MRTAANLQATGIETVVVRPRGDGDGERTVQPLTVEMLDGTATQNLFGASIELFGAVATFDSDANPRDHRARRPRGPRDHAGRRVQVQPRRHPPQARVQPRRGPLDRPDAPWAAGVEQVTAHSGRVGLASELTSRGASTTDVMLAGNWKTSRMVAHYSAGATAERGAVARYL